jgi:glycosyltransferase involved in cell wall biosynthesis
VSAARPNTSAASPPPATLLPDQRRVESPGTGRGVSVVILTKNEEINIGDCLAGLAFSDDIVVLDSGSTDRTVQIAQKYANVRIVYRAFDTEYVQRNFGLSDIQYKNAWVYICDADERVPDDLRSELVKTAADDGQGHAAFRLRYKNYFLGRWIRRSSGYPVWIIRMVKPDLVRYEVRATNVHPIVQGTTGELKSHFLHFSFNTGLRRWFEKHNFYSDREADEAVRVRAHGFRASLSPAIRDPMGRRRAAKNLSFFLIARGLWRFLYHYVVRLGVLDGSAGVHYCAMISMYEYWIELKIRERERSWRERTEATVLRLLGRSADLAKGRGS